MQLVPEELRGVALAAMAALRRRTGHLTTLRSSCRPELTSSNVCQWTYPGIHHAAKDPFHSERTGPASFKRGLDGQACGRQRQAVGRSSAHRLPTALVRVCTSALPQAFPASAGITAIA